MAKRYDVLLRLLMVGDTGVGKTCLLCRYVNDEYHDTYISTIGIDFKLKVFDIEGQAVKVQIWDTAGQERFESITKQFYRRAQGVMLVYDICSRSSFESLPKWLSYVNQHGIENVVVMLLGNKTDQHQRRQVSSEEAREFAERNNLLLFETSAKARDNIDQAFYVICQQIIQTKSSNRHKNPIINGDCQHHDGVSSTDIPETDHLIPDEDSGQRKWKCCAVL